MKAQTYLHIPKPCHEDWDRMSPTQQGRHCESCCKTVVDFEVMTDQQVLNFFAHAKGETCGRFSDDQLNKALEETKVVKKKGWQWFVATMASLFFFASKSNAQSRSTKGEVKRATTNQSLVEDQKKAQEKLLQQRRLMGKPMIRPVEKNPSQQTEVTHCSTPAIIIEAKADTVFGFQKAPQLIGSVTDEKGNAITGTIISIRTINGLMNFSTNEAGEFFVNNPLKLGEEVELKFSSLGYEEKTVPLTFDESKLELHVQLKEATKQLDEVVVVGYQTRNRTSLTGGGVSIKVQKLRPVDTLTTIKKALGLETFTVFPNPASKGKAVNLTMNETGDYSVQLFDNNAKLITVQNISVSAKKEIKLFNIPSTVSSGLYYIRLVNEKNHKQYTDKIFVQ